MNKVNLKPSLAAVLVLALFGCDSEQVQKIKQKVQQSAESASSVSEEKTAESLFDEEEAKKYDIKNHDQIAYVTQTTLSVDDTLEIANALVRRFPSIVAPHKEDICYATTNRQNAVKKISPVIDGLLVVGSSNSSNSKRLVEVGKKAGCQYSQLIDSVYDIDWRSISGSKSIGLTAGASAPEILINQVIEEFKKRYKATIEFIEITKEDIHFKIPSSIRN